MWPFKKRKNNFKDFPSIGGLMVSKMVVDKKMPPLFIFREKRIRPEDSGWRIFSGFESDEYTNNPQNFGIYAPSTILNIDPSIAGLLLKGIGSVYERKSTKTSWYKVYDYPLEDDYMTTHALTEHWEFNINNLFERHIEEDGALMYTTGDKTVRITAWNYDEPTSKEEIYKEHIDKVNNRDQTTNKTLEKYELSDETVNRVGYRIKENDETKEYDVIYGFCIINNQVLMACFYIDEKEDMEWAIETWKNINTTGK